VTLLVLNEGLIETPVSREEAFARVLRHSAFRTAVGRGAENGLDAPAFAGRRDRSAASLVRAG
jgi:hypothetical protein